MQKDKIGFKNDKIESQVECKSLILSRKQLEKCDDQLDQKINRQDESISAAKAG